jgi:fumarate hydratase, class I
MTHIKQDDVVRSVAEALQYISYYHPPDFVKGLALAFEREQAPAAKDAIAQILINSRMAAEGHRPMCQDTGIITVFLTIGMELNWNGATMSIDDMVNAGVRRAYTDPDNPLRESIVADPAGARQNTHDNTPAVIHHKVVPGDKLGIHVFAKGGGGEAKAHFAVLNPSDSIVDWVLRTVPTMGAGWCPPGMLGIGIGGNPEKAMELAKAALMEPLDMQELQQRGPQGRLEELRIELYEKVNALGIGAQGLGGLTTVLDVKIRDYPTHAALLPVAVIPNCAATRHIAFELSGDGPAQFPAPDLSIWPKLSEDTRTGKRRVNVDGLTKGDFASWKAGDGLLLSGKILTGRDAAHKRLTDMLDRGEKLPVDFTNRLIYYVGPVPPTKSEVVGPAGPTTATRMDKFTRQMLEETGLIGMIGKANRGPEGVAAIHDNGAIYLMAVGGAAYLVSKAIVNARIVAFEDLGMEAIYEFEVKDMPVTVAVDTAGNAVHTTGPREWCARIGKVSMNYLDAPLVEAHG